MLRKNKYAQYDWVDRVIKSCRTIAQYCVSARLVNLFEDKWKDRTLNWYINSSLEAQHKKLTNKDEKKKILKG